MSFYLAIVSPLDAPLYELSFQSQKPTSSTPNQGSGGSSTFPSWSSFTSVSGSTNGDSSNNSNNSSSGDLQPTLGQQGGGGKLGGQLGLISNSAGPVLERHLAQMIAFSALDSVDEVIESTGSLYVHFPHLPTHPSSLVYYTYRAVMAVAMVSVLSGSILGIGN